MDAVTNFFTRMTKENKIVLAFCLLVIVCTLYRDCLLCKYIPKLDGFHMTKEKFEDMGPSAGPQKEEEKQENFENSSKPSMVLFYAPWCPHCKSMMGDWDKLRNRVGRKLEVVKVNCDEKPEMAEKHDIKGFPTIILFKDGRKIHFEGSRNLENFMKFVKENN